MPKKPTRFRAGRRGFTILESLVAIAILLVALTGPMVFAQQSLRAARLAGDQITAFYLAQDAIELVKHVRDENSLSRPRYEWLFGLETAAAGCFTSTGCQLSSPEWEPGNEDEAVEPCLPSGCPLYEQLDAPLPAGRPTGLFGIFGGVGYSRQESKFSRRVKIMAPDESTLDPELGDEALIEVEVSWSTLGVSDAREVLVREHIYNWIQ